MKSRLDRQGQKGRVDCACEFYFQKFPKTVRRSYGGDSCQTCPFLAKEKEQAEVGQSPTLLAICAANGVLRILRGYAAVFSLVKEKKTGYQKVFLIQKSKAFGPIRPFTIKQN